MPDSVADLRELKADLERKRAQLVRTIERAHKIKRWSPFAWLRRRQEAIIEGARKRINQTDDRIKQVKERIEDAQAQPSLGRVQTTETPGAPHWMGAGDVMDQFVEPFMVRRGLPLGSGKRTPAENAAVGGSPNSDHLTTRTTTDARDFPTFSGEDDARALANAMGSRSWYPNSYGAFYVMVDGHQYRVQILWGSGINHGDHVHVGVSATP